MNDYRVSPPLW